MYGEFATDPVVQSLAFEDQRHFVVLLCLKSQGLLDRQFANPQVRLDVIRKTLGLDGNAWAEMRARLCAVGLIDDDLQPCNWDKRQFKSDQDITAAERQQRWRERNALRNGHVTRRDTDTDTDTEKEKSQSARASARTARRLPDDFTLTPERRLVAEAETLPAERTFEQFRDYWRSASGARARKHDWDATWRNWCRSEADRGGGNGNGKGSGRPRLSAVERVYAATQHLIDGASGTGVAVDD
jgi:hypothetical protein